MELRQRIAELEASEAGHRRIEEALRRSEGRYRALIQAVDCAIFTLDRNWSFTFLSLRFEDITGYGVQDLIWHSFTEILAPEYMKTTLDRFRDGLFDRINLPYEVELIHKDGRRIPVELSMLSVLDAGEQPTGVILGAVRDLTELKRMEGELLNAQKLESIGTLAGGIAHDFNNILTAILGNISIARMYLGDVEAAKAVGKILERLTEAEKACVDARDLTQRLLTFSRGGAPIKKAISVAELLKDSASFALRGSNVRCEFSIPSDLWSAEVDQGQITQVISNLVINADQAMPEGGTIKVRAENVSVGAGDALPLEDGEYVKISIQDQGIGIPKEHLQRIFDPYFTAREKSRGLGLATSYSIIKRHNGHITVESQAGTGTIFYIYLPASTERAFVEEEKEEKRLVIGSGRILVMDDEEMVREVASGMLNNVGYEVTTATDGADAIELYKEAEESGQPFDAVIMDLTVAGGMGGKEAIQKLIEIDAEVKAIVSSGYSDDAIMADFRRYGFKGAIAKPYRMEELSEILHRVIMGAGG